MLYDTTLYSPTAARTSARPPNATNIVAPSSSIGAPGGMSAANLKIAEKYIEAFQHLAKTNNTVIIPSNLADIAGLAASAMTVLDRTKVGGAAAR